MSGSSDRQVSTGGRRRDDVAFLVLCVAVVLGPVRWHLVTLGKVLAARLAYPMDIEWMESGSLYQAHRWLEGLPIYASPDRWVPYPYPPMHYVLLWLVGHLGRLDYASARALTLVGVIVVGGILGLEVVRAGRDKVLGATCALLGIASIGAAFPLLGGMVDNIRPDGIALAFAVAGAALVPEGAVSWRRAAAIAAALAAAVYSKQTMLFVGVAVLLYVFARDRRGALRIAVLGAGLCSAALVALEVATDGWFVAWLFDTSRHPLDLGQITWASPILEFAPFLAAVPYLAWRSSTTRPQARVWLWVAVLVGSAVASFLPLVKKFGWLNDMIPLFLLAWPVGAIVALDRVARWTEGSRARAVARIAVVAVGGALLWFLEYDPRTVTPAAEQVAVAERANALVRGLDGCVAVPTYPFLAVRNGRDCGQISAQAITDANVAGKGVDPARALERLAPKWIVLTGSPDEEGLAAGLAHDYDVARTVEFPIAAFYYEFPLEAAHTVVLVRRAPFDKGPADGT